MTQKSRSALFAVALTLMVVLIAVLGYMVWNKRNAEAPRPKAPAPRPEYADTTAPAVESDAGNYEFDDGLRNPVSVTRHELDEFGEGLASVEVFAPDVNNDGQKDRITKSRYENGTAHFYYDYKIELNVGSDFVDITPDNFRTVEGSECALQKLRFVFIPEFQVVKISRPWKDTWTTPTPATRTVYKMTGNKLKEASSKQLKEICNVSDLF